MLNFNQLRAFYEVAKLENVREASKILCVTQPAVSNQIKSFEEFCDLTIFKRPGKRLILTDMGRMILKHCHILFDLEKKIENDIKALHNLQIGVLKVGASKVFAQYLMTPYIDKFHTSYPKITFVLDEGNSRDIGMSLLRFENELGIIARVPDLNGVEFLPIHNFKIVLFASPDHPLAAKSQGIRFHELEGQPIIMKDKGSGARHVVSEVFSRHGLTPNTLLETSNIGVIKQMVSQGECVAFLTEGAVIEDIKNKRLRIIPIIDEEIHVEVIIAYLKDQPLSPAANAFLELIVGNEK